MPDLITTAKGLTNGTSRWARCSVTSEIYDAFMTGPEHMIELFHGYTYSGNPIACAAALGTLDTYEEEGLLTRAAELAPYWEDAAAFAEGLPACHRHPQSRPDRGHRAGADCRRADQARLLGLPGGL
jgi:beta-alanine--pyruvate transaminase